MKRKAFTLVELLVVISIIALLLAIMMPSLQKARELARKVVCKNQMRQITLGSVAYASSNNDKFPQSIGPANPTSVEQAIYETWWGLIGPYVGLDAGKMKNVSEPGRYREISARSLGHCPNHGFMGGSEGDKLSFSYCGNSNILKTWIGKNPNGRGIINYPAVKTTNVKSIHSKILIYEKFDNADWALAYGFSEEKGEEGNIVWRGKPNKTYFGKPALQHYFDGDGPGSGWGATHGKDINYGFADGHTESVNHTLLNDVKYCDTSSSVSR